jgi:hypothetical protein
MEQGFFLAKELNIPWSDIEMMDTRDRAWLVERLEKWFKDRNDAQEKESRSGGSGLSVSDIT